MRILKNVIAVLAFLLALFVNVSAAMDMSPVVNDDITESQRKVIQNISVEKTFLEHVSGANICGLDINGQNVTAVALEDAAINFYHSNGELLYCFQMKINGTYTIQFDDTDDNIVLFINRGKVAVKLNQSGDIIGAGSIDANSQHYRRLSYLSEKTSCYNRVYTCRVDIPSFLSAESMKVTLKNKDTSSLTVLYDDHQLRYRRQIKECIMVASICIVFAAVTATIIRYQYMKKSKN